MREPTSIVETLRMARAKIADPKHWTKGAYARESKRASEDNEVAPNSPAARAWCAAGALISVDAWLNESQAILAEVIGGWQGDPKVIIAYNDAPHRRHRDVMRAFDKAIAKAAALS